MAVNILLIGLSQLLHVDLTPAGDNFVDRRPKDFIMGTSSTLQVWDMACCYFTMIKDQTGMRLLYNVRHDKYGTEHVTTLQKSRQIFDIQCGD